VSRRTYRALILGCALVCLLQARQAGRILIAGFSGPYARHAPYESTSAAGAERSASAVDVAARAPDARAAPTRAAADLARR
jgi:hypothetical protein